MNGIQDRHPRRASSQAGAGDQSARPDEPFCTVNFLLVFPASG